MLLKGANLNKALDQVRAAEAKKLQAQDWDVLKGSRWLLLRRRKRLDGKQRWKLHEILKWNLKTVRAYILVQSFDGLWEYKRPSAARKFLRTWCSGAMRSRIEPIKRVARSLREHEPLIINWFIAKKQYNSGIVEGLNNRVKLRTRKAYGMRTYDALQVTLYHELGKLPEPIVIHRFC